MKLSSHLQSHRLPVSGRSLRAFTLSEMMVVMAIFSMLVAATVSSQIFGLRMFRISETKLTVTADARRALNQIQNEIRSGKSIYVGNGDSASFKLTADHTPAVGNALRIHATADPNSFVYYYLNTNKSSLYRMVSGSDAIQVMARNITNQFAFRAEDFQGNVITNHQKNRVIRMTLQFYQRQYPLAGATGGLYDYFQLQTRITKRADNAD